MNAEQARLEEARTETTQWKKLGSLLSERQWGTVREDYSENGDAWNFLTHDHARSQAYRWGEDGLGGISDDKQRLCFALALWNGRDPILKERRSDARSIRRTRSMRPATDTPSPSAISITFSENSRFLNWVA